MYPSSWYHQFRCTWDESPLSPSPLDPPMTCLVLLSDLAARGVVHGWWSRPLLPDPPLDQKYLYSTLFCPWHAAKQWCECHGTLAILDTEAEFKAFRSSV